MTYHHVLHHNSNLVALFEYLLYSILWVTIKGWKPSIKTKFYLSYQFGQTNVYKRIVFMFFICTEYLMTGLGSLTLCTKVSGHEYVC
jgi:hypothetical protein